MTMAKKRATRNTKGQPWRWPKENNQEHKKTTMTTTKGRMSVTKKT
jgi:hypothetical protein